MKEYKIQDKCFRTYRDYYQLYTSQPNLPILLPVMLLPKLY